LCIFKLDITAATYILHGCKVILEIIAKPGGGGTFKAIGGS
jgi:hypothetical protein